MAFYDSIPFEPESSIGYQVKRVHQAMQAALEPGFASEGLTQAQWSSLVSIHFDRGRTCAELARDLAHDKGAMTRLMDVMADKGWVTRVRDDDDRRHVIIALTDEGRAVAERCRKRVENCWNLWVAEWDDADVHRLLGDLKRLRTAIETAGPCA